MSSNKVLIDVMVDGRFNCQLAYEGSPFPQMVDGKVVPVYDGNDISRFVYEKRPSLKGKAVTIEFATQKVFAR
jgi:hypothetical protein